MSLVFRSSHVNSIVFTKGLEIRAAEQKCVQSDLSPPVNVGIAAWCEQCAAADAAVAGAAGAVGNCRGSLPRSPCCSTYIHTSQCCLYQLVVVTCSATWRCNILTSTVKLNGRISLLQWMRCAAYTFVAHRRSLGWRTAALCLGPSRLRTCHWSLLATPLIRSCHSVM